MNKKIIALVFGIFALVVVGGGVFAYMNARNSADQQNKAEAERIAQQPVVQPEKIDETDKAEKPKTNSEKKVVTPPAKGTYVDYSNDAISKGNNTRLLFFHAPWCPQCRMIEGDIVRDGVPNDVTVIKIDYDSNQALRQQYGVTLQTTFVKVDASGNSIEKFVAYSDPTFANVKENLL